MAAAPTNKPTYPRDMEPTGDYEFDNTLGQELARRLIGEARQSRSPVGIAFALRSLAESGRWSGIEVGFAFALASAAA